MMFVLKISALATILSLSVAHAAPANIEADRKAVGSECKKDAEKIGCKMAMGAGMGKCMFEYKKLHQDWNPSPACKSALKKMRQDNMANRKGRGARGMGGPPSPLAKPGGTPPPPPASAKPAGK
jgi:hypothetical protein